MHPDAPQQRCDAWFDLKERVELEGRLLRTKATRLGQPERGLLVALRYTVPSIVRLG